MIGIRIKKTDLANLSLNPFNIFIPNIYFDLGCHWCLYDSKDFNISTISKNESPIVRP